MKLSMSFKQMRPSNAIKFYTEEKSASLAPYFKGRTTVTWNFSADKIHKTAHCHLVGNSMDFFGEATAEDLHAAIDAALAKVEKQIRKRKEIVKDHLHKNGHRKPVKAAA
jgi:putative sigma-54 modulation protein